MKTVWKFPLFTGEGPFGMYGEREIEAPFGTQFIYVAHQHGQLCLWGVVEDQTALETVELYVSGTGTELPESGLDYIGSSWQDPFVWHVWKKRKKF